MDLHSRNIVYNKALDLYGIDSQTRMLAEEEGELFKAVNKMLRFENIIHEHKDDSDRMTEAMLKDHIAEEMADVLIMIEQQMLHWHITGEQVQEYMNRKIFRLEERIVQAANRRLEYERNNESC